MGFPCFALPICCRKQFYYLVLFLSREYGFKYDVFGIILHALPKKTKGYSKRNPVANYASDAFFFILSGNTLVSTSTPYFFALDFCHLLGCTSSSSSRTNPVSKIDLRSEQISCVTPQSGQRITAHRYHAHHGNFC